VFILASFPVAGQTAAPAPPATIWNTLSAPSMDPSKFARAENVSIVRDAVHITLTDGTIQLTNSVNGVVFGAVFHGNGRLEAVPPNPIEAHQLLLFTKQDTTPLFRLAMPLPKLSVTHATEPLDLTLPAKIDRLSVNAHEDLLADVKQ
jgi:hypothetical protein